MTENIQQGTEAWLQQRLGKVTASRVADVIARTKSGWGAGRANYMAELIAERLTGKPTEGYVNSAMQWGIDTEAHARLAYEFWTDTAVEGVGFVQHPRITMSGASPDGLVGAEGLVEFKCPNTSTHIDTLLGEPIPSKYLTQMMWQMACTGRAWCDWCSFDPRLPESMRLLVRRIRRDGAAISELERQVIDFIAEMDRKVGELNAKFAERTAA